ncbi:type II secretion system protein GspL [Undibacterium sp. Di26W]|uniref:type II secretion system protein GspL n=1 Tax=Undibacterium sp. Di26W TaxID=3413035 RepID=UPI003BF160B6
MASTLYISLPSRAAAQNRPEWAGQGLSFALITAEGRLQQQGQMPLADLKPLAAGAKQVAFLLAATDASLLTVKVPPMSAAKLKTALPNLLEEQLVSDPADLLLVASSVVDGEISVAVADRLWLEDVAKRVKDWPARKLSAYPAQLALAFHPAVDGHSAAACALIEEKDNALELCLRNGEKQGIGLSLDLTGQADALAMLGHLSELPKVDVHVPAAELDAYQQLVGQLGLEEGINLSAISWVTRVAGISQTTPDLMTAIAAEHMASFDWSKWRWPLRLALALLIVNLAALNFEWLSKRKEAQDISKSLTQTYRNSFPKETAILDPLLQMQQKVNVSKRAAGQFAANDFAVMAAQFAQIWDRFGPPGGIAGIEYKERALFIRTKPGIQVPLDKLRTGLAEQSLEISSATDGTLRVTAGGKH